MLWSIGLWSFIKKGYLSVIDARGKSHHYGEDNAQPSVTIKLHDSALHWKFLFNPDLYFGEAYVDGKLTIEKGTLYDLIYLLGLNIAVPGQSPWLLRLKEQAQRLLLKSFATIPASLARKNVAHHYDLSGKLYELFLDKDQQYSCAYFREENRTLEQAQIDKKRHIAAKLLLRPGLEVLDIGSGWGGMALYLARDYQVKVTGLTLSEEQYKVATQRAKDEGLDHFVTFKLLDYRAETKNYDRIVSVGMFEHVGPRQYEDFFSQVMRLLKPDGVMLLHSIGRMDGPGVTNDWLKKYIFPGGYAPALSEVLPIVERLGLWLTDIEILRLHYAFTLAEWRARVEKEKDQIVALYDERFYRMWQFYLTASEIDFRLLYTMVFQMQLTRDIAAVPLTRDYIVDSERGQMAREKTFGR